MKEQIKKICEKLINEKDREKALTLVKELKKALERYEAELIQGKDSRRFIMVKDTAVPYDTALLTLVYMTLYKHKDKNDTVEISYNKIASSVNIGNIAVSNRMSLLIKIGIIEKVGISKKQTNIYKVKNLFIEELKKEEIVTNIHELKNITPKYFKAFKKTAEIIKNTIKRKIEKYTYTIPKGLVPVGKVLVPHTVLRPVLVFVVLYLHRDIKGTVYISNNTITAYVGIGRDTLRKEIALLSSLGWIEITDKKTIGTYRITKHVKGLDDISKDAAVFNMKEFYTTTPSENYGKILIKLCEELSGISFQIKDKEGKNDKRRDC